MDRGSKDIGRPESHACRASSSSSPNKLSSSPARFTGSVSGVDSSESTVFGADVRCGGGVQGREWQRRCLRGMSASSSEPGTSLQSGGGGRVKVREMTDLLGVSKSLILPPFRSSRWEKGLTRVGGAKVIQGCVSGGCSMSDLLRERRGSDINPRDCLRRGPTTGEATL